MMMATNHLGPFLLTKMLLPKLLKNARSRVINVTSSTHRIPTHLDFKEMLASSDAKFATFVRSVASFPIWFFFGALQPLSVSLQTF